MLDRITRHVPHSLRRLVTAPVFTLVIIVTIAIAIGANAAVFTLIDQFLLKPLPVSEPDTLVLVNAPSMPRLRGGSVSGADRGPNGMILRGMNYSLFTTLTERVPVFQTTFARRLFSGFIPWMFGALLVLTGIVFTARTFLVVLAPAYASPVLLAMSAIAFPPLSLWLLVNDVDVAKWRETGRGRMTG